MMNFTPLSDMIKNLQDPYQMTEISLAAALLPPFNWQVLQLEPVTLELYNHAPIAAGIGQLT